MLAGSKLRPRSSPDVIFLGGFGGGNTGNEASLQLAIAVLHELDEQARFIVATPYPAGAESRLGVVAIPCRSRRLEGYPTRSRPVAVLSAIVAETAGLRRLYRMLRSASCVVVPGTGILDDFGESPSRMPLDLLRWSLMARMARTPLHLVCAGAGPILNPISRVEMWTASRLATRVSYRDEWSTRYMDRMHWARRDRTTACDIAFGISASPDTLPWTHDGPPVVGLGVMAYGGWNGAPSGSRYDHYVDTITDLATQLTERGYSIRFLVGQDVDYAVVDHVVGELSKRGLSTGSVSAPRITNFGQLLDSLENTDIVVATRYHNVVAALMMKRVTISLSYATKNGELLRQFGMADLDVPVDEARVPWIMSKIDDARARLRTQDPSATQLLEGLRATARFEMTQALGPSLARAPATCVPPGRPAASREPTSPEPGDSVKRPARDP